MKNFGNGHNARGAVVLMASLTLDMAQVLFVLTQPPLIENEIRSRQQGFPQMMLNYLALI